MRAAWPELPYASWQDTCTTLHLWTQIVGKLRLARTPWLNHSWHVPLYVSARGLATSRIDHGSRAFDAEFDFVEHALVLRTSDGGARRIDLRPHSVADFYAEVMAALEALGVPVRIDRMPSEIAGALPFHGDRTHAAYDAEYAQRFWRILVLVERVLARFRTGFLGKSSPVHFFWGSFDLAATRFSGRRAPRHPGGAPNCPDYVMVEAYSHECSSCGFWPGGGAIDEPAFYSYAYPRPQGYERQPVLPAGARYSEQWGEFIVPYAAIRGASDPEEALMQFFQSTYDATADLGHWDRAALERPTGESP